MSAIARINEYLQLGGLFNPEMMNHEKVRDLLIYCRDEIEELQTIKVSALKITTLETLKFVATQKR